MLITKQNSATPILFIHMWIEKWNYMHQGVKVVNMGGGGWKNGYFYFSLSFLAFP